ncbi:MAG: HAMP domain-containing protein, partial [Woeseiaceae bacterium]|nr:HAMP domain-containing protein [Woeseiaceae bacterium]
MKRLIYGTIVTMGVGSALVALFLLSQTSQNTEEFDRLHITMLMINVGGVLVLFALTVGNLSRLIRDYRKRVPGSRLKARMVGMFVGLAILPLLVVFYFSMQFINRGIDSWFNVEVEAGLDDALALSRASLEMLMRDHLETTVRITNRLRQVAPRQIVFELSLLRRESGASEITIYGASSRIIATSSGLSSASFPKLLSDEVVLQIRQNRPFVSLDDLEEGAYEIRTALPFQSAVNQDLSGVLQAHFPVPERIGRMASNVDTSYSDYKRAVYLRDPLKRIYSLTLTVVLMVSLLASIYGALVLSRRLTSPIQDLVAGTRAVAEGNFDTRVHASSKDEIGF